MPGFAHFLIKYYQDKHRIFIFDAWNSQNALVSFLGSPK